MILDLRLRYEQEVLFAGISEYCGISSIEYVYRGSN